MSRPIVEKKSGISPIWILPFLAVCVGGWLLYKSYRDAGIDITLHLDSAAGITAGKTEVRYEGTKVGLVKEIHVAKGLQGIDLTIEMVKQSAPYLVKDLKFWVERVEIEAGRVTGIDTLLAGSYIGVQLGDSDEPARSFVALDHRPPVPLDAPGLHLTLRAKALYSIQVGSGIYYKNVLIGSVQSHALEKDDSIAIEVFIKPEYASRVKKGSRFWNASGITVAGGISNLKVHIPSLAAIIKGGIMMGTPQALTDSPPAENGQVMPLYEDFEAADYGIPMTLELFTGEGINEESTQVMYRGMKAGSVKRITINKNKHHSVTAEILLDPRVEKILNSGTRFYLVKPQFSVSGIKNLETIISGAYITFIPGEGKPQEHFIVQSGVPESEFAREHSDGLTIQLTAGNLGSVSIGSPVLYKNMRIGQVTDIELRKKEDDILITALVLKEYAAVVTDSSRFYNVSGVEAKASFAAGLKIQTGSLETLVAGGVGFYNPVKGKPAENNSTYHLFADRASAEKSNNGTGNQAPSYGLTIQLTADDLGAVSVGSPVLYKKMMVGTVTDIALREKEDDIIITANILKRYTGLVRNSSRFYNVSGVEVTASFAAGLKIQTGTLESLIAGGVGFYNPVRGKNAKNNSRYHLFADRGSAENADREKIVIHFSDPVGLKKGVQIKYNDIAIGEVTELAYEKKMTMVRTEAMVDRGALDFLNSATRFWLVRPEFSLTGTHHLDTLIKGPYIAMDPGHGPPQREFTATSEVEATTKDIDGLNIVLSTPDLFSLRKGSPIMYRRVKVGEVLNFELSRTFQRVHLQAVIYRQYASIVRENTKFWNASGVHVAGGIFSGIHVDTESLDALLTGAIALATPNNREMGRHVRDGHHFELYAEAKESWSEWSPVLTRPADKK
ncbi:MAG: MlaD family protein [Desulforhopalus sp.]